MEEPGTECYERLMALLGTDVTDADGLIDKAKMAARIFADPELLEGVNAIVHPAVKEYLLAHLERARKDGGVELFFVEAALLIEGGYGALVDEMWYIYADESVRRRRLEQARGYDRERIDNVMSKQLSEEEFRRQCDFVIDNSGLLADSFKQIDKKLEAFTWRE